MNRSDRQRKKKKSKFLMLLVGILAIASMFVIGRVISNFLYPSTSSPTQTVTTSNSSVSQEPEVYSVSEEEKLAMRAQFESLRAINPETIAYIYIPGTLLDEPVTQTGDNATYLSKTFDGGYDALLGTVFMDTDNQPDFSDSLTWLFGHARGSLVPDHRMFKTINYYEDQTYFDQHQFVVIQTPERILYYQAAFMIIVPETTAFYRTEFADGKDFVNQLAAVSQGAVTKNPSITIQSTDRYLVLSTCREEDPTIRSNLYLRQIPDTELTDFLAQHGPSLAYVPTR